MTKAHTQILARAKSFAADPDNNPWAVSTGQLITVTERLAAVRTMEPAKLLACLEWPTTEQRVKIVIESRLRQLRKARANEKAE